MANRWTTSLLSATCLVVLFASASAAQADAGGAGVVHGNAPLPGLNVVLMAARPEGRPPLQLGSARSGPGGAFTIRYRHSRPNAVKYLRATRPGGGAEAGYLVPGSTYRLAAALGTGPIPKRAALDERTTVAMGFAMAQFVAGGEVRGSEPGLRNSAAMTTNLVRRGGGLSPVLRSFPNGSSTSTMATFGSLANLIAACRQQGFGCAALLSAAKAPGGSPAANTLAAVVNIADYPWHNAGALYQLSQRARQLYRPALGPGEAPVAWTLALRFEGDPPGLDGPGNFAIDADGNLWVANNYAYSRQARKPACGSEAVFRFTPTGQTYPGSPYTGGGLSGVGFGIAIDPSDRVWLGNFGFEGQGCETAANHYSVSQFSIEGKVESPERGWEVGGINWPQGTVSDRAGNIWLANCGNNSVTRIAAGNPALAVNLSEAQITAGAGAFGRPFGAAVDPDGNVFVTGNESATVAKLGPNGEPLALFSGGGLHRPLGIAGDSKGNMWVSNSTWVVAPCVGEFHQQSGPRGGGTVTLIKSSGKLAAKPFEGGGLRNPWGIAVDGDDNVWVANFGGRRLSELCGIEVRNCPPGKRRTGAAISPQGSGYGFDGLVRNTGVAIDPSGNVWLANNWKNAPIQTNPGGYQIVAYLGLAAPVKAPQIGPPEGL